ncbi:MAG: hypothetical protein QM758_00385 [Armatimonas sp.]
MSDEYLKVLAIHEAGHAVASRLCGFPVKRIRFDVNPESAENTADLSDFTASPTNGDTCASFYYELICLAAGKSAEMLFTLEYEPKTLSTDSADIAAMTMLIHMIIPKYDIANRDRILPEVLELIDYFWSKSKKLLDTEERRAAIHAISERLINQGSGLNEFEIESILSIYLVEQDRGLRQPLMSYPDWYLEKLGKSKEAMYDLRERDFQNIWRYHETGRFESLDPECGP